MIEDTPETRAVLASNLLSGKRRSPRKRRTLIAEIGEPGGTRYEARTVDVSRGGMLLEFVDDKLRAPSDPAELVGFATRLITMFPTGLATTFGSGAVRTHATVVRLVSSASTASPILLGCRFDRPLTDVDCRLLGLELEGDETEGDTPTTAAADEGFDGLLGFLQDPSRSLDFDLGDPATNETYVPSPTLADDDIALSGRRTAATRPSLGTPMSPPWAEPGEIVAHLFPVGAPVFGPRYRGRLVHAETGLAFVDLALPPDESDPFGWAAGLGASVRLVALCDGCVLWETLAAVTRFDVMPDDHVRATVRPEHVPSPALLGALPTAAAAR